jgi:hypothetical protein
MKSTLKRLAAVAALGTVGILAPVGGASAASLPAASVPPSAQPVALLFVPPKVGPIGVDIAPTFINGQMTDPGLHMLMPGVSLPPISWTLPPIR